MKDNPLKMKNGRRPQKIKKWRRHTKKSQDCDVAAIAIQPVFPSFLLHTVPFTLYFFNNTFMILSFYSILDILF